MSGIANFSILLIMAAMKSMNLVGVATDDSQYALVGNICSTQQTNSTVFHENLDAVLASLRANLSAYGFATSLQNKSGKTDAVYGLAVCQKYLSASDCSECFTNAISQLKSYCNQSKGGMIHLDGCFLRCENTNFYKQAVDAGASSNYCASINDTSPQTFSQRARVLLAQLIRNASANNSYAAGSINAGYLYGLAQCWPSLTNSSCQACLTEAQKQLLTCLPRRGGEGLEAGCVLRYATYSFFQTSSPNLTTNQVPNLTPSMGKSSSKILPILLGSTGGTALIAVLCLVMYRVCIRNRKSYLNSTDENLAARENFEQVYFDYAVLRNSTENFDRNNMLGKGGFGEVYKGRLPDGTDIAVKKLNERRTTQAAEEFMREVDLLKNIHHRNLVRLLGCCTQGHERLLVYEYMSNNSLDKHLFGRLRNFLSWETRFNIIVGTARGLAYLHEETNIRIIHRDIKCANILLDERFNPKIADFGLARLFPEHESHVSTRVGGTVGYTAPEYAVHGRLTEKADVYSYGIVVLEIVSGRKCTDARLAAPMKLLLEWAWNQYKSDQVLDILDPTVEGKCPSEQVLRVITIALLCTQGSAALRPAMSEVLSMLNNDSDISVQPTQPAFIYASTSVKPRSSKRSASSGSAESHGSTTVSVLPR